MKKLWRKEKSKLSWSRVNQVQLISKKDMNKGILTAALTPKGR